MRCWLGGLEGGRVVFVHGIGGPRDTHAERAGWLAALAEGARLAGHGDAARDLRSGAVDAVFADYSDLFAPAQRQSGAGESDLDDVAEPGERRELDALLDSLVRAMVAELREEYGASPDPRERRVLTAAAAQLAAEESQAQGPARVLVNVLTTVLQLPGLRHGAQWTSGRQLLGQLSQVGRYLRRGEPDGSGATLDARARARVHAALAGGRPAVVVAHSLGTVVALEALHAHAGPPVPLLVTLGSPIAMGTVVWPRLLPHPPSTPESVGRWLNFWDRDDVVVARPRVERRVAANAAGVAAETRRVDSDGIWVHTATKYLRQPAVAGPIVEALGRCA